MTHRRWSAARIGIGILAVACVVLALPVSATAVEACGSSNGLAICVSAPEGRLTGDVPIAVAVNGAASDVKEMIFQWGPSTSSTAHLLTDFEAPFGFTWRTDQYLDGTQFMNVRVKRFD